MLGHLGHLGAMLEHLLGPSWRHVGPSWNYPGPSWRHLGAMLEHLGTMLEHLAAMLGHLCENRKIINFLTVFKDFKPSVGLC